MSKKPLNEGLTERVLTAIWTALLSGKRDKLLKKLERDPEFKASVERLAKIQKEIESTIVARQKKDPRYAEFDKWYTDNIFGAGR